MKKKQRVIKVQVPKEIWDADMSIWNWNRDIMGAWNNSLNDVNTVVSNFGKNNAENHF